MHRLQRNITNIHGLTEHVAEHHNLGSVNVNKIKDQGSNNIQYEQKAHTMQYVPYSPLG